MSRKYKMSCYLNSDELDFIEEYCRNHGISKSEFIRLLIISFIRYKKRRTGGQKTYIDDMLGFGHAYGDHI